MNDRTFKVRRSDQGNFLRTSFALCSLSLCIALAGCTKELSVGIQAGGTVTVDGKPLSGAVMTFEPMGSTTGPSASAPIFGGSFRLTDDNGLHGGKYRIRISMIPAGILRSIPKEQQVGLPPSDSVIAPEYDGKSKLEWTLLPDQDNTLEFDVSFL
ncbi:hypothetical protein LOC67_24085 [Stieleria sp. JC731]|uniref:hypothetical protein n=1 Tax=Pirellulaceae TaxID=2691357 RepID=UPI001E5DD599|nr:hypothetical protein [Stieleria sp. JC731]MCC9603640.1 hypothetical protein [Stieleria sp. JC731]